MAPRTRMPDSFVTQSGWNKISFNIGSKKGSKSSLNTVAKTSKAAAEHFPKIKKLNGFYTVYMYYICLYIICERCWTGSLL